MKKYIPNSITCLNLFSGIVGVIAAYNNRFDLALYFVLLSAVFDFFDGFSARLLKAYSPMGKELDSLADMISFGLLPGMVAFRLLSNSYLDNVWLPYLGFFLTIYSALRLAKFNIDERQTSSFIGLATPANAIFWVSLAFVSNETLSTMPILVLILVAFFSFMLVSPLPMFSLKVKHLGWNDNRDIYLFLIGVAACLLLTVLFYPGSIVLALPIIIVWYIVWAFILFLIRR